MPEDFYQFWDFCKEICPDDPISMIQLTICMIFLYINLIFLSDSLEAIGLKLTGPFDVLAGNLPGRSWEQCVLHGRHYFDPPEFQTVAMRNDGFHIGYFRYTDILLIFFLKFEQ